MTDGCHLISKNGLITGGCEVQLDIKLHDLDAVRDYLSKRIQVLFAGAIGEALDGSNVNNENANIIITGPEGKSDFDKARELLHLLANIRADTECDHMESLDDTKDKTWTAATQLIEKNSKQIYRLRDALLHAATQNEGTVRLSNEECISAMDEGHM